MTRTLRLMLSLPWIGGVGCASLGGVPAIVDNRVATEAAALGDAELMADVAQLKNKRLQPAEMSVGLCVQQYVRGRAAEVALASATDEQGQHTAKAEMLVAYTTCATQCGQASQSGSSSHREIGARYQPRCAAASDASEESLATDRLAQLVGIYREATQPLGLFFADQDAADLIDLVHEKHYASDRISALESEFNALREANAEAIEKGRAFFEGEAAQANFELRAANEAEQASLHTQRVRLEAEHEEAVDAGLTVRAQNIQSEIRELETRLEATIAAHAELEAQYEAMAHAAGVYTRP